MPRFQRSCCVVGVSAASVHNASCWVGNVERVANASKRGSRNAGVVCSIALYMFCKTKRSAALQTPRFQRSCSMALNQRHPTCSLDVSFDLRMKPHVTLFSGHLIETSNYRTFLFHTQNAFATEIWQSACRSSLPMYKVSLCEESHTS
jgi:hypothetical protein